MFQTQGYIVNYRFFNNKRHELFLVFSQNVLLLAFSIIKNKYDQLCNQI